MAATLILLQSEDESAMLLSIVPVCLVGLGLSIKALLPAGEDPAAREDQLGRADCREGLLIFEAANWLEKCDAIRSGGGSSTTRGESQSEPKRAR